MNKTDSPDSKAIFISYAGSDGDVNVQVFLKDEYVCMAQKAMVYFLLKRHY